MISLSWSLTCVVVLLGVRNTSSFSITHSRTPRVNRLTNSRLRNVLLESNVDSLPKKSYLDDGFVFGLEGSGIERPKGKEPSLVVDGDELETKPYQVAMVLSTFAFHFFLCITSILQMLDQNHGNGILTALQCMIVFFTSWTLADFGSGVLHWSVDNYGNGRTPIMGGIIAAFQGHHSAPWTITYREFCNNVYKLCIPFGIPTTLFISLLNGSQHPMTTLFFTVFCATEILSQEFHKWAHQTPHETPNIVNFLQNNGILLRRKTHALHHMAPYEGNYCIISGICNEPLDQIGFFRWLEHVIYRINRVESNAWKLDYELKMRTLKGDYSFVSR